MKRHKKKSVPQIVPPDALLTDATAAPLLGVEPRTLRLWRLTRGLPHIKLTPKIVRYRRSDLDAWLDAHRVAMV